MKNMFNKTEKLFQYKNENKFLLFWFKYKKKIKYIMFLAIVFFFFYTHEVINNEQLLVKNKNFVEENSTFVKRNIILIKENLALAKKKLTFIKENLTFAKENLTVVNDNLTFVKENLTLVTALYKIKSKRSFYFYQQWINNFLKINKPVIFFIDPKISETIKSKRSSKFKNKTKWIELEMKEFYTYKKYLKYFKETNLIDKERYHTVELYLVWAEKIVFLKKAIEDNPFNSTCFYWIDAGYFRERSYKQNFLDNWPSTKRCIEDPRITFISMRQLGSDVIKTFQYLNMTHSFFNVTNVGGNFFGGTSLYILEFYKKYFEALEVWHNNSFFIGKDQNIFAYVIYLNPQYCKLVYPGRNGHWWYSMEYFL